MADKIQNTREISDSFYLLNLGFVASYMLDAGGELVAFDAGMNAGKVKTESAKLNLDPSRVQYVFLTHSDRDHTDGLPAFPKARIYLPRDEVAMLNHSTPRFFGLIYSKPLGRDYEVVEDGRLLKIGSASIRCVSTPGHTKGSMSYLVNDSILIVGDELNLKNGRAVLDRKFMAIDNPKRRESITKLASLKGVRLLCPMHSGYSEDALNALKEWRGL
jgi:glyoxylase-like metal-dependent hydrolase (beta-lactamase superfamily II)